jgi:hypothetical protein
MAHVAAALAVIELQKFKTSMGLPIGRRLAYIFLIRNPKIKSNTINLR